jgi:hypothetical protein
MAGASGQLPPFTEDGLLPPGDYELTLDDIARSMLVVGPDDAAPYPLWDTAWRARLVEKLGVLVRQLWQVGIDRVFIDGSFTEDKDHPNDIDGYFECELAQLASGDLQRALNSIDPHRIWTWDPQLRRPFQGYPKMQLPMWHEYRVELYPHVGQLSGIRDRFGNEMEFPAAFRRTRSGQPKGIVMIGGRP